MAFVSRGFRGRRRADGPPGRVPPGQYLVDRLPGALGRADARTCRSTSGTSRSPARSTTRSRGPGTSSWRCRASASRVDIHCVTKWSKLDTDWEGVSLDTLLGRRRDGGRVRGRARTAATPPTCRSTTCSTARPGSPYAYDGEPLEPEHGGPARLLVPHLYFWKSAKWVRGLRLLDDGRARLLGELRLPQLRRPMARTALRGRLTWQVGRRSAADGRRDAGARARLVLRRARLARPPAPASTSTSA